MDIDNDRKFDIVLLSSYLPPIVAYGMGGLSFDYVVSLSFKFRTNVFL